MVPLADTSLVYSSARHQNELAALSNHAAGKNLDKVQAAAESFESFFLSQALQAMFAGIKTNETFGGGIGEDKWRSLLIDEYGKSIAKAGGIGLADHVVKAMLQAQETTP
ncbi:chemotactic signal-response protein chel [Haematospirillum jordaniae]|uniref:Flagellar protein FlgJ N-terminal domain-containing protein n=1 Tax=Haematospirillum jordaniae TaxID=1549855 RepID=A0A143DAU5_9PROT|nr:rod-binding protein [Haematospirillum jordaniae]AMW33845.1 hypothetical protein AY555_00185 [Haematospirillum jordaniae]NKD44516.1 chemotactic signal-response protein chel [Haematospirillum jordaniae]NKD57536.1 chemotactic signal-response protein chel [Haematospirillum jordaniae]NKD59486.1 chemotactic signal-response protein chel [Haematospirillum jordaniae]NKD67481.1 chemotactic signal-response protein chel [Haematospirillum jordaniae]